MCAGQSNLGDMCIFHHIPNPMCASPENGCSQQAFNVTWPGDSEIITWVQLHTILLVCARAHHTAAVVVLYRRRHPYIIFLYRVIGPFRSPMPRRRLQEVRKPSFFFHPHAKDCGLDIQSTSLRPVPFPPRWPEVADPSGFRLAWVRFGKGRVCPNPSITA